MKQCTKCDLVKDYSDFSKSKKSSDGFDWWCRLCRKAYYQKNKEKILAMQKQYFQMNRHKKMEWIIANKEKIAARQNRYTADLKTSYVVNMMRISNTSLKQSDIPTELIEAKRLQIMIKRTAKEMQK